MESSEHMASIFLLIPEIQEGLRTVLLESSDRVEKERKAREQMEVLESRNIVLKIFVDNEWIEGKLVEITDTSIQAIIKQIDRSTPHVKVKLGQSTFRGNVMWYQETSDNEFLCKFFVHSTEDLTKLLQVS